MASEKKDDGGQAFPRAGSNGMSLRDYFAAHAPEPPADVVRRYHEAGFGMLEGRVRWAWAYAEAMLVERSKTDGK